MQYITMTSRHQSLIQHYNKTEKKFDQEFCFNWFGS